MANLIDLTGRKFGRLTVVEHLGKNTKGKHKWLCVCDCGNKTTVIGSNLKKQNTTSCGCYHKDIMARHNQYNTRLYKIWDTMKSRCYNHKQQEFKNYGARGINVCNEWKRDFRLFYEWAITNGYKEYLTIDRIDVNGNYEPSNCRWITNKEQQNNRRNNRLITYNNETHTVQQWSEITGLTYKTIQSRLDLLGWDIEKALTKPSQIKRKGLNN